MKPYYEIDSITKRRIMSLIIQCDKLGLENISFDYHETPVSREASFYLSKTNKWSLVTCSDDSKCRDVYKIFAGDIIHQYSENDQDTKPKEYKIGEWDDMEEDGRIRAAKRALKEMCQEARQLKEK